MHKHNKERLEQKEYLGDGVYAGFDGLRIVLWLEQPGTYGTNAVALEPKLLQALEDYKEKLRGGGDT